MKMQILDLSRVSGGDPSGRIIRVAVVKSFPRKRGWSSFRQYLAGDAKVFPAQAGVIFVGPNN